nr:retrovirus-related Pol polyprotein from transposon TNT 1-94 [Tanacetum cinerariifolium]
MRKDELLNKQIQLENKIKELDIILVKMGQSIQMMHMFSPKPDSFYHTKQKMTLGYENPFYPKQAQQKQQSLYNGKVLLEKHDLPNVYDSEETLQLAQESHLKRKQLNKEIKRQIIQILIIFRGFLFLKRPSHGSEQKDTTKGTSVNTQFCKQSILGKPHSSSKPKLYVVTPFQKSKGLPKIDETYALSKPITTISVPIPQEIKVVKNDNVIALGMFRINPFKPAREEKYVPNKVRVSVRTNPITVSQPHVITKNDVNSDSNGLSSTGVDNTAMTRRPQPRSNTKNDGVSFASKSSCIKNKEFELEEYLSYVNDMNSRAKKQKANVSNNENQKKQKPTVMKPKKVVFLRLKDKAPEEIKTFLKKIAVLLQAPVIISLQPKDKENHGDHERLDLSYALSTITTQKPTESELDLLFESMYDDHIGGQPSAAPRTVLAAQAPQFKRLDVWVLVPPQDDIKPLTLKWLLKNKHDEENTVIQNKNHLVVRRYCQEDGIDFEESFAPVARMEAIRISLAYATYKSFTMFQIDMKIAFLHGTLKEDVYMCQPEGFIDADYPSHVYKLKKALYGLKQAPREWSMLMILSLVLLTIGRKDTFKSNSSGGQFLGEKLSNYVLEILKKYGMETCEPIGTLMEIKDKLDLDQNVSPVDATKYHSMIGRKDTFKSNSSGGQFLGEKLTQLTDYGYNFNKIPIYYDSKSAIAISCNSVQHSRTKHIDVRYNFIKEHVEKGMIELYFFKTNYQMADLFTKVTLNRRDLPRNIPIDGVEVLGVNEKKSKLRKEIVLTKMELVLEQTQQGTSHEVSVRTKGVEEGKRNAQIRRIFLDGYNVLDVRTFLHHSGANSWQWEHPPLAVGTYTASGNSLLADTLYRLQNINTMCLYRKLGTSYLTDEYAVSSVMSEHYTGNLEANERPPMLERGNYIPRKSRFRRVLDNKLEEGERMWNSIKNGPYVRPMIPDPDGAKNINVFHMAQQVIPAAQLVPRFHTIGGCNNYAVLQSIPCSPECKIVEKILLDYPLGYALTTTIDVLVIPVQAPDNPFVAPVNIKTIEVFINRVGYQGVVDKVSAFYMKNLGQPWQTMFKVFNRCLTTRTSGHYQTKINILQMFHVVINLTDNDYAALLWWDFMNNVKQKEEAIYTRKLDEEEIDKMVDGDEDEESYASKFADLVLNDDVDDSGTKLEPESHKENPEKVFDDDVEIEKEKKDDENVKKDKKAEEIKKDKNDVEKIDDVVKEKDIVDDIHEVLDHCNKVVPDITFVKTKEMIIKEMPRLINLAVNKDREVDPINAQEMIAKVFTTHGQKMIEELFQKHMHNTTLNHYPTTSMSTAGKSSANLQHQLYLNMKSKCLDIKTKDFIDAIKDYYCYWSSWKRLSGLESIEARLIVYKKNESVYEEDIKILKRAIFLKDIAIIELRRKLELAQKQKDKIQLTVENFENSSKTSRKLLNSQIVDKCKLGFRYNVVIPPYTGNLFPLKPNLSSLQEFKNEPIVSETTVKKPVVETSEVKASVDKPKRVNTIRNKNVNTARPKEVLNVVKGNEVYAVKASTCWVWKPKTKVVDHVSKNNSASITLKKFDYVYAQDKFKFVQVFLNNQLEEMANHTRIYVIPSHTKKIFSNMRRFGKDFSGRETPLFPTMMVQAQEEMGEEFVAYEVVNEEMDDSLVRATITASSLEAKQDCGNIATTQTKTTSNEPSSQGTSLEDELKRTKTAQQSKTDGLDRRIKKLEKNHKSRTHKLKRLYKVSLTTRVISSSNNEALDKEDTSKQGRIDEIDDDEDIALVSIHNNVVQDKGIEDVVSASETIVTTALTLLLNLQRQRKAKLIEEPEVLKKRKHQIRADEKLAKQLQAKINKENRIAIEKDQQVKEKDEAETVQESSSKRTGDDLEQERSKKHKMKDDKESIELKQC